MVQRNKDGSPKMDANGKPMELTSHTLNPVPIAIGGPALPDNVKFRQGIDWNVVCVCGFRLEREAFMELSPHCLAIFRKQWVQVQQMHASSNMLL